MTYELIIGGALLTLLVFYAGARAQRRPVRTMEELEGQTVPVDLEAFRALLDSDTEQFLFTRLGPNDFRRLQRRRMLVAAGYVRCIAHNASVLLRLSESARTSSDPAISRAGADLAQTALRVRLASLAMLAQVYCRVAFPRQAPQTVAQQYELLTSCVSRLGLLQQPARLGRILASL